MILEVKKFFMLQVMYSILLKHQPKIGDTTTIFGEIKKYFFKAYFSMSNQNIFCEQAANPI
ncbi:MAG: hypothetical protein ACTSRW_03960 [Candidatus Helarchaeota archaeon]